MTLDLRQMCSVCAWRVTCAKKQSVRETALHCPDFTRDLSLGPADAPEKSAELHKKVDDVFGTRK